MLEATAASHDDDARECTGCKGAKGAPLAARVHIGNDGVNIVLCEECGRDLANAIGFMCVRDGWSKLEPRKRRVRRAE